MADVFQCFILTLSILFKSFDIYYNIGRILFFEWQVWSLKVGIIFFNFGPKWSSFFIFPVSMIQILLYGVSIYEILEKLVTYMAIGIIRLTIANGFMMMTMTVPNNLNIHWRWRWRQTSLRNKWYRHNDTVVILDQWSKQIIVFLIIVYYNRG